MGSRSHYTYDGPIHRRRFLFALGSLNILDHLPIHAPRRGPGYEEGCAINEGHGGTQVTAAGNRHANRWLRSDYLCCASHGPTPHTPRSLIGAVTVWIKGPIIKCFAAAHFGERFASKLRLDVMRVRLDGLSPPTKARGHGPRDQNV